MLRPESRCLESDEGERNDASSATAAGIGSRPPRMHSFRRLFLVRCDGQVRTSLGTGQRKWIRQQCGCIRQVLRKFDKVASTALIQFPATARRWRADRALVGRGRRRSRRDYGGGIAVCSSWRFIEPCLRKASRFAPSHERLRRIPLRDSTSRRRAPETARRCRTSVSPVPAPTRASPAARFARR